MAVVASGLSLSTRGRVPVSGLGLGLRGLLGGLIDSGSIPAASFPCYSAAVLKLTLPYAQVGRVSGPTATVRIVLAPYADVRTC